MQKNTSEKNCNNEATDKWKLNVQGVLVNSKSSTIIVRDALSQAGFDPSHGWQIFLKIKNESKQEKSLSDVIDLTAPGIEKLRLTPTDVSNGEPIKRDFELLDVDENYLNQANVPWETVILNAKRWLLIHDYKVPQGYSPDKVTLALDIPNTYPGAQIDMFYTFPTLVLESGRPLEATQVNINIADKSFNRWSRHRGGLSTWNPANDNVIMQLALVESALVKEVD